MASFAVDDPVDSVPLFVAQRWIARAGIKPITER
jgi:hypothetical protein